MRLRLFHLFAVYVVRVDLFVFLVDVVVDVVNVVADVVRCGWVLLALEVRPVVEAAEQVQEEQRLRRQQEHDELRVITGTEEQLEVVDEDYAELNLERIENTLVSR